MAKKQINPTDLLLQNIVKGMQEKKALSISVLNLEKINASVADFFVICHGSNQRQVEAISESVEIEVHKALKEWPWHTEGQSNSEWILLDYINVVVHVFMEEKREFYALEELWGDAEITQFE